MEAHQILEHLRLYLPTLAISQDGLSSWAIGTQDLRRVVYTVSFAYDEKTRLWSMRGKIRIRYKINSRVRLYVKALEYPLSEYGIMVDVHEPCFIRLSVAYNEEFFTDSVPENVAGQLAEEFHGLAPLMMCIARLAHASYRLAGRGGTHEYQKVMPSRLAELTLCNAHQVMS